MQTATRPTTKPQFSTGLAKPEDAAAIAAMFEAALGSKGYMAPDHEPYPEPALFTADGILSIIDAYPDRRLIIVKADNKPVGGMVIDMLHPYQCEFNCMAVPLDLRGSGIGSKLVQGARAAVDESFFTMNSTELVTHSMMSQSAHIRNGLSRITGFSYCHYPRVFFAKHPESVMWVTGPQGRLAKALPLLRQKLGTSAEAAGIEKQLSGALKQEFGELFQDTAQIQLAAEVLRPRPIFAPPAYRDLVQKILAQFADAFDYRLETSARAVPAGPSSTKGKLNVNRVDGYEHAYLSYEPNFAFDPNELDTAINELRQSGKRFMLVRLPANDAGTIEVAEHLRARNFFFHSIVPLYGHKAREQGAPEQGAPEQGAPELYDILTLQWVAPHIREQNPLPGETNSVINLYGYPVNLSGDILSLIRSELNGGQA